MHFMQAITEDRILQASVAIAGASLWFTLAFGDGRFLVLLPAAIIAVQRFRRSSVISCRTTTTIGCEGLKDEGPRGALRIPTRRLDAFVHLADQPGSALACFLQLLGGASTYLRPALGRNRRLRRRRRAAQERRTMNRVHVARFAVRRSSVTIAGMRRALGLAAIAAVAALALCSTDSAVAGPKGLQHVTLIGDSVATAISGTSSALAVVNQGIDLDLEADAVPPARGRELPARARRP